VCIVAHYNWHETASILATTGTTPSMLAITGTTTSMLATTGTTTRLLATTGAPTRTFASTDTNNTLFAFACTNEPGDFHLECVRADAKDLRRQDGYLPPRRLPQTLRHRRLDLLLPATTLFRQRRLRPKLHPKPC
jgi:hypothetical protein